MKVLPDNPENRTVYGYKPMLFRKGTQAHIEMKKAPALFEEALKEHIKYGWVNPLTPVSLFKREQTDYSTGCKPGILEHLTEMAGMLKSGRLHYYSAVSIFDKGIHPKTGKRVSYIAIPDTTLAYTSTDAVTAPVKLPNGDGYLIAVDKLPIEILVSYLKELATTTIQHDIYPDYRDADLQALMNLCFRYTNRKVSAFRKSSTIAMTANPTPLGEVLYTVGLKLVNGDESNTASNKTWVHEINKHPLTILAYLLSHYEQRKLNGDDDLVTLTATLNNL
jgi:hypothetical protein